MRVVRTKAEDFPKVIHVDFKASVADDPENYIIREIKESCCMGSIVVLYYYLHWYLLLILFNKRVDATYCTTDMLDIKWLIENLPRSNAFFEFRVYGEIFKKIGKETQDAYVARVKPYFQDIIMKTIYPRNYRCNFTNQEYACLFSHLNVIKKFSNSNYEVALIIEDDITLEYKNYWKQNVRQIMENAPKDWEIIQLGYTIGNYNKIPEELYILNVDRKFYGTGAYIIKKSSAKNFIQNLIKGDKYLLNKNIPYTADIYIYKMLKTYVYKYPYFTYPTNNDSYIHNEHLPDHFRSKELTNSLYKS
jgi:GR25 family glycosyltransferase involved in LPS biosynthesis